MTLEKLLTQISTNNVLEKPVICFTASSYPLLFLSQLFHYLKKKQRLIIPNMENIELVQAQLGTSFLGLGSWYWLRSFDELSKSDHQKLFSYLSDYTGTNTIFFFSSVVPNPVPPAWMVVDLPAYADTSLLNQIASWYGASQSGITAMKKYISSHQISVDMAVMMVQYSLVMGTAKDEFFTQWLHKLIPSLHSLFSLSQAFFAKQSHEFFTKLDEMQNQYAAQFWISFWSDQLWRACMYVKLMNARKPIEAKKISFRLPFSFLNRDWKKYSYQELRQAHHFLYAIDYHLKHGTHEMVLDLFYSKFVTGNFQAVP